MTTSQFEKSEGSQMGYLEDFQEALALQDSAKLLRLWEEYTQLEEMDPEDLRAILKEVKKSLLADYVGRHIERILPFYDRFKEQDAGKEILKLILDLQSSNSEQFRAMAFDYLEKEQAHTAHHQEKMKLIGLRGAQDDFKAAISRYELLSHLQKGHFVFHTGGWGVGEILEVSYIREQAAIEFDFFPGHKEIAFRTAFNCLLPIEKDHFLAMRFGNPDLLEEKAKKDPVEVIQMLLRDLGPKTASEIKDELCDLVIPAKDWNRWWQNARTKLKKNSFIQTPDDLKDSFRLLKKEISHEERLGKALENKPDADTLIQMVYSYQKDFAETLKNSKFKATLKNKLSEILTYPEVTEAQKIQILFLIQDLTHEEAKETIMQIINASLPNIENFLDEVRIQSFKKRILIEIKHFLEDWQALFIRLLAIVDQSLLRDYLLSELISAGKKKEVQARMEEVALQPIQFPEALVWYFQKIISEPDLPHSSPQGRSKFFEAFLILLSHLEQYDERRDLMKKMQNMLYGNRYSIVRSIMKESSAKEVQEFLLLATKCRSLSDHDIKILHSLAEVAHPSLAKKDQKFREVEEEDFIWTTREGYLKLQKRIEQIATVETVENAKEIEVARAHGDLRENSEFKFALEKRDRLQSELKFLSEQLNKARILTKDDISLDSVSVGLAVEAKKKTGEKLSYTLLGPWDADPDQGIISYQSKLAKAMIGLKVGDKFLVQGEEYTIALLKPAIL